MRDFEAEASICPQRQICQPIRSGEVEENVAEGGTTVMCTLSRGNFR